MEVGLGPSHIMLDGDPAPPRKWTQPPILANVSCGQTAGWIKMPLGTEVRLGPGDTVLDWDPAPPTQKGGGGHSTPNFGRYLFWSNGWMDSTWYGGRPRSRPHYIRWGLSSPLKKGHNPPSPQFWPMSVVAKRLDGLGYHLVRRYASAGQATLDGDPAPPTGPTERGTVAPPHFWATAVARWPTSAAAKQS